MIRRRLPQPNGSRNGNLVIGQMSKAEHVTTAI